MNLDVVIVVFQCRPHIFRQGIELACFQGIALHFLEFMSHKSGSTSSLELNCAISPFTVSRIIIPALPSLFT